MQVGMMSRCPVMTNTPCNSLLQKQVTCLGPLQGQVHLLTSQAQDSVSLVCRGCYNKVPENGTL